MYLGYGSLKRASSRGNFIRVPAASHRAMTRESRTSVSDGAAEKVLLRKPTVE